ncbi:MAG: ABC transporter substrate-binding protein [Candidatus Muiribacteriota bacterium]
MKKTVIPFAVIIILLIFLSFFVFKSESKNEKASNVLSISASLGEDEWQVMREQIFPEFEKKHNARIRSVNIEAGDTLQKVEIMHRANSMDVDLLFLDNMNLAPYVEKRLLLNLNRFSDLIEPEVYPALVEPLKFDGNLMFFPGRPNVQITYFNTDIFNENGYKIPKNWDELLDTAKKLKDEFGRGRIAVHGTLDANTTTQVFEFIVQAGGDITKLNDEGCIKAFTFLQKLWPYLSEESVRANWNTTNRYLSDGSIYLGRNWPFGMNVIVQQNKKDNISAYGGWAGPEGKGTMIGGDVIAIPRRTKNQELALKFAQFLMSKEVQKIFVSELGWPPIREDAMTDVPDWQKPFFEAVLEALEYGHYRPAIMGWDSVDNYVNRAFQDIVIDGMDVEETLDKYAVDLQNELEWMNY